MALRQPRPTLVTVGLSCALIALATLGAAADAGRTGPVLAAEPPLLRKAPAAPSAAPAPRSAAPTPRPAEPIAPALAPISAHGAAAPLPPEAARVIALVNAERAAAGLPALGAAPELAAAALAYSAEMAASGIIAHSGADGRGPAQRLLDAGYGWLRCGENLAVGQPTPEEAVAFWMGSPPHRANILDPLMTEVGAGYVRQPGGYGHYWTLELGARRP